MTSGAEPYISEESTRPPPCSIKKGNEWHAGVKARIGVDTVSGLAHMVAGTGANVSGSNIAQAATLLHGEVSRVHADAGYITLDKREEMKDRGLTFDIAKKRGAVCKLLAGLAREVARSKAQLRVFGEHQCSRGLAKNSAQMFSLFALPNGARETVYIPQRALAS
jgi:transposase, IS5 family